MIRITSCIVCSLSSHLQQSKVANLYESPLILLVACGFTQIAVQRIMVLLSCKGESVDCGDQRHKEASVRAISAKLPLQSSLFYKQNKWANEYLTGKVLECLNAFQAHHFKPVTSEFFKMHRNWLLIKATLHTVKLLH